MSLQDALDGCIDEIADKFDVGTLLSSMQNWDTNWPVIFDEEVRDERTVRDWFVPSRTVELNISSPATFLDFQKVSVVVVQTLEAGIAAETAGRISGAQATSMETAYNTAWT